jgi:hypothetical protein
MGKSLYFDTLVSLSISNLFFEVSKEQSIVYSRILFPTTLGRSKMISCSIPQGQQILPPHMLFDLSSCSSTLEERRVFYNLINITVLSHELGDIERGLGLFSQAHSSTKRKAYEILSIHRSR